MLSAGSAMETGILKISSSTEILRLGLQGLFFLFQLAQSLLILKTAEKVQDHCHWVLDDYQLISS